MEVLFWALITVAFIIAEILTIQLVSIWFGAGGFITMLCSYFMETTFVEELIIFIVSSTALLLITFPFLKNRRKVNHVGTNSELEIGRTANVIQQIDNVRGTGRVRLNGVDWSAVSADGDDIIPVDTVVTVVQVQGAKLFVTSKT